MSVHGDYLITIQTPNGPVEAELSVEVDGTHMTGDIHDNNGHKAEITDGHFDGGHVTWKAHITDPAPADLVFDGHCDDTACTHIHGEVHAGAAGDFKFTGVKE